MCFVSLEIFHEFFLNIYGTPNNLLLAVQEELSEIKNIAGCRALRSLSEI